jgi:hypothetical protein
MKYFTITSTSDVIKNVAMPRRGRRPDHPHLVVGPCRAGDNPWIYGTWCSSAREEMDANFRAAVQREIAAGTENCATAPSTCFGTKQPIAGYTRPDE